MIRESGNLPRGRVRRPRARPRRSHRVSDPFPRESVLARPLPALRPRARPRARPPRPRLAGTSCRARLPGDHRGRERLRHARVRRRRRSCRSRRPPPRCCSRSARAIRWSPPTATPTIRPRRRPPSCRRTSRTSRRSRPTIRISSSIADDLGDLQKSLDKLHIPAIQQPAAVSDRRRLRAARAARTGHRTRCRGDRRRSTICRRRSPPCPRRSATGVRHDVLLRAGRHLLLGHLGHVHRQSARPARA